MNAISSAPAPARRPTLLAGLVFFLLMTAYYLIRPVRDQFSAAAGSAALPRYFGYTMLVMLALTPLFGFLVSRLARRWLLILSYGFFLLCLLGFIPWMGGAMTTPGLGLVFYVWVGVFNLFVVALFWSCMADVFSPAQARQDFPLIAFAGMGGALLGPWLSGRMVYWSGIGSLLALSALALLLALLGLLWIDRSRRGVAMDAAKATQAIGGSMWAGVTHTLRSPFLRNITLLMLCGDAVGTLAYMLVADYAKAHLQLRADRVAFYAHVDLCINMIGAGLQLTLSRWLMQRLGASWCLILPTLANTAVLLWMAFGATGPLWLGGVMVVPPVLLLVVTRSLMYGMTKPASDALYTRTSRENRYKGKNFIETTVWRGGDVALTTAVRALMQAGVGTAGIAMAGAGMAALGALAAWRTGWARDLRPLSETPDQD